MKTCFRCKVEKNESEFYSKGKENRLQSYCKPCLCRKQMDRWTERKVKAVGYLGGKCLDCKNQYPLAVYEFHHRDPSQKEFNWVKMRLQNWNVVLNELDKCDLLCANCHRIRHMK